jgi:hypothetical protein
MQDDESTKKDDIRYAAASDWTFTQHNFHHSWRNPEEDPSWNRIYVFNPEFLKDLTCSRCVPPNVKPATIVCGTCQGKYCAQCHKDDREEFGCGVDSAIVLVGDNKVRWTLGDLPMTLKDPLDMFEDDRIRVITLKE